MVSGEFAIAWANRTSARFTVLSSSGRAGRFRSWSVINTESAIRCSAPWEGSVIPLYCDYCRKCGNEVQAGASVQWINLPFAADRRELWALLLRAETDALFLEIRFRDLCVF